MTLDRADSEGFSAGNGAFFILFSDLFQNLCYYAETMGGQRWAFFETCNALLRQWEGKSDDFPCFLQSLLQDQSLLKGLPTSILARYAILSWV